MTVHLIKLCVGVETIEDLAAWQRDHRTRHSSVVDKLCAYHTTRQRPKRHDELLEGGSIYWVIKGLIQVRQNLIGFDDTRNAHGVKCCVLLLDTTLVPVRPIPRRAFQGWRYLDAEDAPSDLGADKDTGVVDMPLKLRQQLAALCLI